MLSTIVPLALSTLVGLPLGVTTAEGLDNGTAQQTLQSVQRKPARTFVEKVEGELPSAMAPEQIASDYLQRHQERLGMAGFGMKLRSNLTTALGTWVPFAPTIKGVRVLGYGLKIHVSRDGRVDRLSGRVGTDLVSADFEISPQESLLRAMGHGPLFGLVDPSIERDPGTVARAYLNVNSILRPVYRVFPRSHHPLERYEVLVDAASGEVLASYNRAVSASEEACGNVFTPTPGPTLEDTDIQPTLLPNAYADDDGYLRGTYFATYNCCNNIDCDPDGEQSRYQGSMPNPVGFGANPIYFDIVVCDDAPKAKAKNGRFFYDAIDPEPGAADYDLALEDEFAEPSVYFNAQNLFSYIRQIGNPQFLLNAHGTGSIVQPFHISVNYRVPDYMQAYQQVAPAPLGPGRGTQDDPVIIDDYSRISNAMFVPGSQPPPDEYPIELLSRDYDSIIFFQGERRDFGYDGDIVYHEFGHAVVDATAHLTGMSVVDEQGSLGAPGAINEGYGDYWAATLSNDSRTGEYGGFEDSAEEAGIRDADNDRVCPDDLTGEVHDDSWPWSGALWDLRNIFVADNCDRDTFDEAIYDSMAGLMEFTDFDSAAELTAQAIDDAYPGQSGYDIAHCIFHRRGMMNCERVIRIHSVDGAGDSQSDPLDVLFVPSADSVISSQAPTQMQLRIDIPKGTTVLTVEWSEGGGGMGISMGGGAAFNLLLKRDEPIVYSTSGTNLSHDADQEVTVTRSQGTLTTPPAPDPVELTVDEACGATYYVAFLNPGGGSTAAEVEASVVTDSTLADSCTGDLDVAPEPNVEDPATCAALPTTIGDSEACSFEPPHVPTPCPKEKEAKKEDPKTEGGCDCRSQGTGPLSSLVGLAVVALLWSRRRR